MSKLVWLCIFLDGFWNCICCVLHQDFYLVPSYVKWNFCVQSLFSILSQPGSAPSALSCVHKIHEICGYLQDSYHSKDVDSWLTKYKTEYSSIKYLGPHNFLKEHEARNKALWVDISFAVLLWRLQGRHLSVIYKTLTWNKRQQNITVA